MLSRETKSFYSELSNKVKYLYQALDQCNNIVKHLEKENQFLKETCWNITNMQVQEAQKKNQDGGVDKSME
jgi:hypothetical protein